MKLIKMFSNLLDNLILCWIVILIFEGNVYAQRESGTDSVKTLSDFQSNPELNKISYQKSTSSFYRTDSIFSFRSSKGYFPSLLHNIGEQAMAPFHFKARQWIYTGVAAGIATVLIFADEDIDNVARTQKEKHQ